MADAGRYRIVRSLGRGGMAEVFEAVAVGEGGFERRVAIKRMLGELRDDPAFATLFLDEARTASALHHANLVAVFDYGLADGAPFQALEFVDGMDAERLVRTGREYNAPMPVEVALHLCLQVAHALEYVHGATDASGASLGIVHRDVSPSNVLVAWSGDVKLTDFGIAVARTRATETAAGVIRGKPAFMAPEQVVRGAVDGRTDVFGLGCTLHALLTGVSPLSRENAMVTLLAGSPLELDPALPEDVHRIVARATRGSRVERYPSMAAMAGDLSAALATRGAHDPRAGLQRWLAAVREAIQPQAPRRGALDALLSVELMLEEGASDVRRFVTAPARPDARALREPDDTDEGRPTRPAREPRPDGAPARRDPTLPAADHRPTHPDRLPVAPPRSEASPVARELPARRPLVVPIAAVAAALVAIGVAVGWRGGSNHPALPPTPDSRPAVPAPRIDAPAVPTSSIILPSARVAVVDVDAGAPAPLAVTPPRRVVHADHGHGPPAAVTPPPPAPVPGLPSPAGPLVETTGVVAIGGEAAQRAQIFVDDAPQGFAPRALTLPVGRHVVRVVRAEGPALGPVTIDLEARHTASTPLRVRFTEP